MIDQVLRVLQLETRVIMTRWDPSCRACLFQDLKEAEQMRRLVRHSPAELFILPAGSDATGLMHEIGNCKASEYSRR